MKKIIEPLMHHLKARKCAFDFDGEKEVIHFGMEGENARWRCVGCADDAGGIALLSLIPLQAPQHRRAACAELLARINWRTGLGHFDLDFTDGELRFLTVVPLGKDSALPDEVIAHLLCGHQTLVDTYIPAISAVIFAGIPPAKALEQDSQPSDNVPRFSLN